MFADEVNKTQPKSVTYSNVDHKTDTQDIPKIAANCTSGKEYLYYLSSLNYDIYKAKREVPNHEGYGYIPAGAEIADVTYTLGVFRRLYCRIMRYTAWQFTKTDDTRPRDYYYIKSLSLYRRSGYFTLEGTSFFKQRTPFQCKVIRLHDWFSNLFGRKE